MSNTPQSRKARIEAIAERREDIRKKTRNGLSKDFWDHYGPFLSSLCFDDVDAFLEDRARLEAELTQAQAQLKQCAELLTECAAAIVGNTPEDWLAREEPLLRRVGDMQAKLRTAADQAAPVTKQEDSTP